MNDYLSVLEGILDWYGVVGMILCALAAVDWLDFKISLTRKRFFVLWLLCLSLTASPLLFPSLESALSPAAYDRLLFIGSLVCWNSAKCLLLAITLKRSLFLDKGYLLFILYFLLLLFGESCDLSAFPIIATLSILWMLAPTSRLLAPTKKE